MVNRRNTIVNQPALIPIAGNYDKKPRVLEKDVTTIGRARGTDLCLEANEISTLHCVIYRSYDGYRIRDCNSRCGTRINGESVKTGHLRDCDIVNIGPFSFEFRLPVEIFPNDSRPNPVKVEHWVASRRRLAERALKLRKRLRRESTIEHEYEQKAHLLKDKIRCYDQRVGELRAAEEELEQERRQFGAEAEKHRQHFQQVEQELAKRLKQADDDIHQRWQEFQQRCKAEEHERRQFAAESEEHRQHFHQVEQDLAKRMREAEEEINQRWLDFKERCQAEQVQMQVRQKETMHDELGQRLQDVRDHTLKMQELDEQLNRRQAQRQNDQQEFNKMKEQWAQDQAKASATLDGQMATLAKQKAEVVRMMTDLRKLQDDLRQQPKADHRALEKTVEQLERDNAELRLQLLQKAADDNTSEIEELKAAIGALNDELQSKEQALQELELKAGPTDAALQAENELLKQLLEEKEQAIHEATLQAAAVPKTSGDLENYETELNEFRRQLEADRVKLNDEVESLRDRNKELDDAIRDMEMEMSKERAELARERMRLERLRDEVKSDAERLQREQSVRDSMAPVQKLRDQLTGKQPPAKPATERPRTMREIANPPTAAS